MKTIQELNIELANLLNEWDKAFIKNPGAACGYDNFTDMYKQAHSEIVDKFIQDKFDTLNDDSLENLEKAQNYYETIACDIRFDADLRMQEFEI